MSFALRAKELPGGERLRRVRKAALERFAYLGFPTTKNEDWKYTNLAPYLKTPYEPAPAEAPGAWNLEGADGPLLAFVNGRFAPELSRWEGVRGLKVAGLRESIAAAESHVARYAAFETNAMVALNTALFEDGAFIEIADAAVIEQPIQLLFLTRGGGKSLMTFPRNLIVAGRDSQAQIVEVYCGDGGAAYFTDTVTELIAGDGAVLDHYKFQEERDAALHFGMLAVRQGESSNFTSHNLALGGALARNEITVLLDGEGAECTLNGLYVTAGRQHIDNYTTLDHAKPHSTSRELYKGILDGKSQGVFHGRIIVRPEAQKTDAIQRNKNLLLSAEAVINTKPQLEIYADDVRCTHGATVGQVDQEAVFYLRSRGIALAEARSLLTYAFTSDVIENIKVEALRSRLAEAVLRRLGGESHEHAR